MIVKWNWAKIVWDFTQNFEAVKCLFWYVFVVFETSYEDVFASENPAVFWEDLYYLPERDAPLKGKAYIIHGWGAWSSNLLKRA